MSISNKIVLGYGSLMCRESALRTCPGAGWPTPAIVSGWERIFNVEANYRNDCHRSNWVDDSGQKIAVVGVQEKATEFILCSAIHIPEGEFFALELRERSYDFVEVDWRPYHDQSFVGQGMLCVPKDIPGVERDRSILPIPQYVAHCLAAAAHMGPAFAQNFMQAKLADNNKKISDFLDRDMQFEKCCPLNLCKNVST